MTSKPVDSPAVSAGESTSVARPVDHRAWRRALPVLSDRCVTLRSLIEADTPSLFHHIAPVSVTRHLRGCPSSAEELAGFVRLMDKQRESGQRLCFGIVPTGAPGPVGLMQLWPVEPDFSTAEWGFIMGQDYWGTGVFVHSARLLLDFAFDTLDVTRLEARSAEHNSRGNGALTKLGAKLEGVLRGGFRSGDVACDHLMWSILRDEWVLKREQLPISSECVHADPARR